MGLVQKLKEEWRLLDKEFSFLADLERGRATPEDIDNYIDHLEKLKEPRTFIGDAVSLAYPLFHPVKTLDAGRYVKRKLSHISYGIYG